MRKKDRIKVFFNASVILAGLGSPKGGSAKLLSEVLKKQIAGYISEVVFDEALRHADKIGFNKQKLEKAILKIFKNLSKAPKKSIVEKYKKIVIDLGDAHILASCEELNTKFLITLDKKHLLSLQKKVKTFKILSPGEFIELVLK